MGEVLSKLDCVDSASDPERVLGLMARLNQESPASKKILQFNEIDFWSYIHFSVFRIQKRIRNVMR